MDYILDNIDFAQVYDTVVENVSNEFGIAIDKVAEGYNITTFLRDPRNHLRLDEEGPITINGRNYRASKVYFETLDLATKNCVRAEAYKYLSEYQKTEEYIEVPNKEKKSVDLEFRSKFSVLLHKYFLALRHREKVASGEINQKPTKPNYASKKEYIRNCVGTSIIKLYIDDAKMLVTLLDK